MSHFTRSITFATFAISQLHCGASVIPTHDGAIGADAAPDVAVDAFVAPDVAGDVLPVEDAIPLPGHCGPLNPVELTAPLVLMEGQTLGLTATSRGSAFSCGASPMLSGEAASLTWSFYACGGCEACDCRDTGYQASTEVPAPAAGSHTLTVGATTRTLQVFPAAQCQSMAGWPGAIEVQVVGPDRTLRDSGAPHLWWAHLTGTESRCCGEPAVAATVSHVRPVGADIAIETSECSPDLCACVGGPHPFEAWVDLGDLPPGMHGIEVPGASAITQFEVPAGP